MACFAANSLLCRQALRRTGIDEASFTLIRVFSGAITLALIVRLRRGRFEIGGDWGSAIALFAYAACFSFAYRHLTAAHKGALRPKTSWGTWRKLAPEKLPAHVKKHPDATLKELQTVFGVSQHAVWVRLEQLGFTLKKNS